MTTTTRLTVADRVNAGAAWLDEHHPDWLDRIDLDVLAMSDCERCVLGQLFGSYEKAPLGDPDNPTDWVDEEVASPLGFESAGEPLRRLTAAWRDLILARRARKVVNDVRS